MSNENLETRIEEVRGEASAADARQWVALDDERISRIAGDENNERQTMSVSAAVVQLHAELSAERETRSVDDLGLQTKLTKLNQALSDYSIKSDLALNQESIARRQLGVDLNSRIDSTESTFSHEKYLVYQAIQGVLDTHKADHTDLNNRVKKYEEMLQNITMDSIQITMDNGEINMGAWTILSQAREWDLELLKQLKDVGSGLSVDLQDAMDNLQSQIPTEKELIDLLLENLADHPLIKEMDSIIQDQHDLIMGQGDALALESKKRAEELAAKASELANEFRAHSEELLRIVNEETLARVDALAREAEIRAAQLANEADIRAADMQAHADDLRGQLDADLADVDDRVLEAKKQAESAIAMADQLALDLNAQADELLQKVTDEALARTEEILSSASQLRSEMQMRSDTLVEAITAKAAEVTSAMSGKVDALRDKVTLDMSNLSDGFSKSVIELKDADASIIASVNTYKVSNDSAVAAVKQSVTTLTTAHESTASDLNVLTASFEDLTDSVVKNTADIITANTVRANADSALSEQINSLKASTISDKAQLTSQINSVNSAVTNLNSATATKFDELEASLIDTNSDLGATNTLLASVRSIAESAVTVNTAQTTKIDDLSSRMETTEGAVSKKADATAVSGLTTRVDNIDGELVTQSSAITSLSGSIETVDAKANSATTAAATAQQTADTAVSTNAAQATDINSLKSRVTLTENSLVKKADAVALSSLETKVDNNQTAMAQQITNLAATLTELGEGTETMVDTIAFNALKSEVTNTKGVVTGHTSQISALQASLDLVQDKADTNATNIKANSTAITEMGSEVASVKGEVASQSKAITTLTNNLTTTNTAVSKKADSTVVTALTGRVTTAEGKISSQAEQITALNNSLETVEDGLATKADATALSTLTNRVTQAEGTNTTQSQQLTKLTNDLTTTNNSLATKATTSALNALDSKVTDIDGKVDANTASVNSLNSSMSTVQGDLKTKASADAVTALTTRVTSAEGVNTTQNSNIAKLQSDLTTTNNNVATKASTTALNALDTKITETNGKVSVNTSSITSLQGKLTTVENGLALKADASALNNIYTKAQADSVISGAVSNYDTSLKAEQARADYVLATHRNGSALAGYWGRGMYKPNEELVHTFARGMNLVKFDASGVSTLVGTYDVYGRFATAMASLHTALEELTTTTYFALVGVDSVLNFGSSTSADAVAVRDLLVKAGANDKDLAKCNQNILPVFVGRVGAGAGCGIMSLLTSTETGAWLHVPLTLIGGQPVGMGEASPLTLSIDANASAISATNAEVTSLKGTVSSHSTSITNLNNSLATTNNNVATKANSSAVTALASRVTSVEGVNTTQNSNITSLQGELSTVKGDLATKAAVSALNSLDTKITETNGKVATNTSSITSLNGKMTTVENGLKTKADASALNSIYTKTETGEAIADQVTALKASMTGKGVNLLPLTVVQAEGNQLSYPIANLRHEILPSSVSPEIKALKFTVITTNLGSSRYWFYSSSYVKYNLTVKASTRYIVSAWFDASEDMQIDARLRREDTGAYSSSAKQLVTAGGLKRYSFVVTIPSSFTGTKANLCFYGANDVPLKDGWILVDGLMLEEALTNESTYASTYALPTSNDVLASAVSDLNVRTTNIEGVYASQSDSLTSLTNSLNTLQGTVNTKADAAAINALTTRVTAEEGKSTSHGNAITSLQNTINHASTGLASKAAASALNDIYTKTQADAKATEIAAGEVAKYDATLSIGGANLLAGTQAFSGFSYYGTKHTITKVDEVAHTDIVRTVKTISGAQGILSSEPNRNTVLQQGKKYVITFLARGSVIPNYTYVMASTASGGNTSVSFTREDAFNDITFVKFTGIFTAVVDRTKAYIMISNNGGAVGSWFDIKEVMFQEGTKATPWEPSYLDVQSALDVNATAIENTNAEVSRVDGRVTTESGRITSLTGRVSTVEGAVSTKADASALNSLTTRVTNAEGVNTTQGASITSLTNDMTAVKGDLSTKATASALNTLDTKVTDANGKITANTNSITNLNSKMTTVENGLKTKAETSALGGYYTKQQMEDKASEISAGKVDELKASMSAETLDNLVIGGNVSKSKTGGYLQVSYPLSKDLSSTDKDITVRAKVTFDNGGNTDNNLRIYIGGGVVFNAAKPIRDAKEEVFEFTTKTLGRTGSKAVNFYCFPNASSNAVATTTVHWVEVYEGRNTLLDATTSAISATNAEIVTVKGSIASQANSITNLQASLAGKADGSALSALTSRVTDAEGKITSASNSITSLNSSMNAVNDVITVKDTRSANQTPAWYFTNYPSRVVNEFKIASVIGVTGLGTYVNLETRVYYSDASGGNIIQTAYAANDPSLQMQRSGSNTTWSAWKQPIKELTDLVGTKANASALSSLDTKVASIDGRVTVQAEQATVLRSDLNGNMAGLASTNKVVDGVKAVNAVSVDVNGFVSGYGIISQLVNGVVTSSFNVNASIFSVGSTAANKKKPFIVTTANQVVNGVTYPAGVWMDVATIADATIGNAKIANLDAGKITAGYISADRIAAKSINADKLIIGDGDNLWVNRHFDASGPIPNSTRSSWYPYTPELNGCGVQCYGRDHIAPYSSRIPISKGERIYFEYTMGINVAGVATNQGIGLWCYRADGGESPTPFIYSSDKTLIKSLGGGWYRYSTTIEIPQGSTAGDYAYGCLYIQLEQSNTAAKPSYITFGDVLVRRSVSNALIVNGGITADKLAVNSVTADKINVANLSLISGNLGTISVGSANITNGAITTAKIGDLQVDTIKIKDNAVTSLIDIRRAAANTVVDFPAHSAGSKQTVRVKVVLASGLNTKHRYLVHWRGAISLSISSAIGYGGGSDLYLYFGSSSSTTVVGSSQIAWGHTNLANTPTYNHERAYVGTNDQWSIAEAVVDNAGQLCIWGVAEWTLMNQNALAGAVKATLYNTDLTILMTEYKK